MIDVSFGSHEQQAVDFYWPDAEVPQRGWPVVVGFHGLSGDKSKMYGFCQTMISESEFTRACIAAGYRNEGYGMGVKVQDVASSLKWLVKNAASYNVDSWKIAVYGYSQGGMLVNSFLWEYIDFANRRVSAAILVAAIGGSGVSQALNSSDSHHPPLLVIHCKNDNLLDYKFTEDFLNKLAPVRGIVRRLTYLKGKHGPQSQPFFWSQIDAFLDSPSTYKVPDPLTLTPTPAPPTCRGLCDSNQAKWSKKCSWAVCGACNECSN